MPRWLRHLIWIVEAVFVLVVVYSEPDHGVRGKLWREAFYDGKPTSWWRSELALWDVRIPRPPVPQPPPKEAERLDQPIEELFFRSRRFRRDQYILYSREQTFLEKTKERWWPRSQQQEVELRLAEIIMSTGGPSLLHGGKDAEPVLRELLQDDSPKIRRFARIGLKMDPHKE